MEFKKEELIKSPLNYTGGKFKLLPQILPLLPNDINTFIDLFSGGCNVGINVKADCIICNDIESHIIDLFYYFKTINSNKLLNDIESIIDKYGLSNTYKNGYEYYNTNSSDGVAKYNKDKYLKMRSDFNKDTSNSLLFYCVLVFAFNNQIRFNSKGEFNMPVNKRDFNKSLRSSLVKFVDKLNEINIHFANYDFNELNIDELNESDFVYCDPPYLVTCASYNEQDGWDETKEKELLELLDKLNEKGIRFALSNVLEHKGKSNDILKEWSKKYTVHHLNKDYSNCSYHTKDKSKTSTDEVLITNYI